MAVNLDTLDLSILQRVQGDLPLSTDPMGELANELGCTPEDLLDRLKRLTDQGIIKRIGAVLHHRKSGYTANGLFVARVKADHIQAMGERLSQLKSVSHCYERYPAPDWPYNLYAMIHGKSKAEVMTTVTQFTHSAAIQDYEVLFSTEELKKTSFRL
ncbi:Lrp/AsnC family transcriptional regulator [Paenibacillus sp. CAA11]|uniref:siroheme decarboxylase subunit beta n=1 Tax=Paenibacillus sp. CAA11 TaxID=1532905 RepID=UPI000D38BB13|nr:Lrp/AsnC family transcriptional regulator [Paenibacillus sp. CAA11]AWB43873.1 Lrp/AsnC family transcriptional regulator [Paenibacillus sp. CAA11]